MGPTFLSSLLVTVWKALEARGIDAASVFREAGLDPEHLRDPGSRFGNLGGNRFLELAVERAGSPCFGLEIARHWHPSSFGALGYAWMVSATLRDGLTRLIRYFHLVNANAGIVLREELDQFVLSFETLDGRYRTPDVGYDAVMAMVVEMCRSSAGETFRPLAVELQRAKPSCAKKFEEFFGAPVRFQSGFNRLILSKPVLTQWLPTANAELAMANDRAIARYVAEMGESTIESRVRAKLINQLSLGEFSVEAVASTLHMSRRTLQRKLRDEGFSFKIVLEQLRRDLALRFADQGELSSKEIAYILGFSEPSNFSRAFRRWTGTTLAGYRATERPRLS